MTDIAFVLVHYHCADLLRRAVGAILADLGASGIAAEILVVDNGSDHAERQVLAELPIRCLSPGSNTGYAAALNEGARNTRASVLLLMNPDVLVLPGCTSTLVRALQDGASVAGPRFYWDVKKQFLMPPTEQRTITAELTGATAEWSAVSARWARRRWRRHARRHWCAREPIATACLSGAMLAVRRDAIEKIGPFDEEFRLYFEEQDWLTRLVANGLTPLYLPAAEAIHLFNQSAVREPMTAKWEAESWSRFAAKHHPAWLPVAVSALRSSVVRHK